MYTYVSWMARSDSTVLYHPKMGARALLYRHEEARQLVAGYFGSLFLMKAKWIYLTVGLVLVVLSAVLCLVHQNPKVSIIVPVYNGEKTVERTMDSLLKQTLKDIEIIVVDDGSTDNTPAILDKYAAEYEKVKVIHQQNAYVGAARNAGRKQAKGEYIAFIDADDTVSEDFYEKLYLEAEKHHADIVAAENVLFVWENKDNLTEPYQERAVFTENDMIEDLASYRQKIDGYVWDKLYRKAFLDEHNIWCTLRRTPAEDNFLTTPALMFADKMYVAKGATFYYHRGSPSETGVKHTKLNDEIMEMFADLDEFIRSSGLGKEKIDKWLGANAVARRRIVGNYYDCLQEPDKAVAKEKILMAFPEDNVIFEHSLENNGQHNQLYQQI